MRILVTGGAGYIGSHIVVELLEQGHQVLVLDDLCRGNRQNLFLDHEAYNLIEASIDDPAALEQVVRFRPAICYHFAAYKAAGESMYKPELYSARNVRASFALIEALVAMGCDKLIFSSTAAVYGEPEYLPIDEVHPLQPMNYYGFSKLCIEQNIGWFGRLKGLQYVILRYFNAAGYDRQGRIQGKENQPQNLFPVLMEVATGLRDQIEIFGTDYDTPDGTCIRDYVHVNDLADGHTRSMQFLLNGGQSQVINLGSENGLSVKQALAAVEAITGRTLAVQESDRRAGDPMSIIASSNKAQAVLGWQAQNSDAHTIAESMWSVYKS